MKYLVIIRNDKIGEILQKEFISWYYRNIFEDALSWCDQVNEDHAGYGEFELVSITRIAIM